MAWFAKKPEGPTPEEIAAEEERQRREAAEAELRRKLTLALEKEPAFQVVTVDGMHWICPFTLALVPAAFGFVEPAREYLFEKQPWKGGAKQRTAEEVHVQRWRLHLKANLEFEPRLRIFGADQRWLNPYSGQWVKLPVRPGMPQQQILEAVAAALAASPEARKGQLLELAKLREIEQRAQRSEGSGGGEVGGVSATKRVAGKSGEFTQGAAGDDLSRAKSILDRMLAEMPAVPGFGISVHYEPHAEVGGDFFACLPLGPDRFLLLVADVAGHGVQGAFVVVAALKALRFIVKETQELVEILARLNDSVKADLLAGQFITCWAAVLAPADRRLEMVCAGHHGVGIANPKSDNALRRIAAKGPALGLMAGPVFRKALRPVTVELQPGDTLMQTTDGLEEASDPHKEEFGELRALGSLLGNCELPHDELVDRIAADGRRWAAGTFQDDVTVMVVQCEPPAPAAADASS